MVEKTISQNLRGTSSTPLPQDNIAIFLSDQRLQFVVADHLYQPHLLKEYVDVSKANGISLLQAVFSVDKDLRKAYNQAFLVLKSPVALLEPLDMDKEGVAGLFKSLIPSTAGVVRLNDRIEGQGIKAIYPFDESSSSLAKQMFPNLTFLHHHTLLIRHFAALSAHLPNDRVYAQLDADSLSVFYYKDANLQYANQFQATNNEDRVYYIMLIYKQFALDASAVVLSLSLGSGIESKFMNRIRPYVRHIDNLEYKPRDLSSDPVFRDSTVFKQYYLPLSVMGVLEETTTNS